MVGREGVGEGGVERAKLRFHVYLFVECSLFERIYGKVQIHLETLLCSMTVGKNNQGKTSMLHPHAGYLFKMVCSLQGFSCWTG